MSGWGGEGGWRRDEGAGMGSGKKVGRNEGVVEKRMEGSGMKGDEVSRGSAKGWKGRGPLSRLCKLAMLYLAPTQCWQEINKIPSSLLSSSLQILQIMDILETQPFALCRRGYPLFV